MWDRPSFAIVDVGKPDPPPMSPINASHLDNGADEVAVNMKAMEKRYAFENEMIRAVSLGQLHKEKQLLSAFGGSFFEKRLTDPLRNAKNYAIIMNTLLRKAAESGGVHPLYLDRISSEFAARIEQLQHLSEQGLASRIQVCRVEVVYAELPRPQDLGLRLVVVDAIALAREAHAAVTQNRYGVSLAVVPVLHESHPPPLARHAARTYRTPRSSRFTISS
jgi:hypothetical protein